MVKCPPAVACRRDSGVGLEICARNYEFLDLYVIGIVQILRYHWRGLKMITLDVIIT